MMPCHTRGISCNLLFKTKHELLYYVKAVSLDLLNANTIIHIIRAYLLHFWDKCRKVLRCRVQSEHRIVPFVERLSHSILQSSSNCKCQGSCLSQLNKNPCAIYNSAQVSGSIEYAMLLNLQLNWLILKSRSKTLFLIYHGMRHQTAYVYYISY